MPKVSFHPGNPKVVTQELLKRQERIQLQLAELAKNDPVLNLDVEDNPELGTEAWKAEVHGYSQALRNNLLNLSSQIKKALAGLRNGTYGSCEKCGRQIELERLNALPVATLCSICVHFLVKASR